MKNKTRGTQAVLKESLKLCSTAGIVKKELLSNSEIEFLRATGYVQVLLGGIAAINAMVF